MAKKKKEPKAKSIERKVYYYKLYQLAIFLTYIYNYITMMGMTLKSVV